MNELNKQGIINWKNEPSIRYNTDEGFESPTKICSRVLLDSDTIYVSSIFYLIPELKVIDIIVDGLELKYCQKWFQIPHDIDAQNQYLSED